MISDFFFLLFLILSACIALIEFESVPRVHTEDLAKINKLTIVYIRIIFSVSIENYTHYVFVSNGTLLMCTNLSSVISALVTCF